MANVLITGGCGFFGAWIIRKLIDDGHDVTAWDIERNPKRWKIVMSDEQISRIQFKQVRIEDVNAVKKAMAECAPDAVIHLAGLQVPTCKAQPLAGATVNVLGTLAIFEAAKALDTPPGIAYASSAAVFGSDQDYSGEVGDDSPLHPGTLYGAFKRCNELSAKVYWKDFGLKSVGFRPLTVYGPGRDVGMTSYPTRAIAAALLKQRFDIPFSGRTVYTYVEEVAAYFTAAALNAPEGAPSFTVSGSIVDTAQFIEELDKNLPGSRDLITASGGDLPIASRLKDEALRRAYPGIARISLADGIARTLEIFRTLNADHALEI